MQSKYHLLLSFWIISPSINKQMFAHYLLRSNDVCLSVSAFFYFAQNLIENHSVTYKFFRAHRSSLSTSTVKNVSLSAENVRAPCKANGMKRRKMKNQTEEMKTSISRMQNIGFCLKYLVVEKKRKRNNNTAAVRAAQLRSWPQYITNEWITYQLHMHTK